MPHDMAGNDGNPDRGTAPFDGESIHFEFQARAFHAPTAWNGPYPFSDKRAVSQSILFFAIR